jgi:hypothetical protein
MGGSLKGQSSGSCSMQPLGLYIAQSPRSWDVPRGPACSEGFIAQLASKAVYAASGGRSGASHDSSDGDYRKQRVERATNVPGIQ